MSHDLRQDQFSRYRAVPRPTEPLPPVDPVTTQVVRYALNSAANQMKTALVRTAFSPVIYEVLDFAVGIYDPKLRLLAQAPSLPLFMGTLNFCIDEAVRNSGGVEELEPGDVILYNSPYGTGAHPQDLATVMPVFHRDVLIGYAAIKAHWLDIGAKDPYCTDTIDVFQEGTVYPGVKIYRRGERVEDIFRLVMANTRVPHMVIGDMNAQITGVRVGASSLERVVERFGPDVFWPCVEHMYDHGERTVRAYVDKIPDGRYVGHGEMDNNGIEDKTIPFEVTVEISGSNVLVDFTNVPGEQIGPVNCPLPSTVSASRVAISMLAGFGEAPNEGHFRTVEVLTRPGTMFHPRSPAPCFLYGWPAMQAIEVIYHAISKALPDNVPASSGGDLAACVWWGKREATGEVWVDGAPHPCGQGAWKGGDGGTMLHISESATRFTPMEVFEARNPWVIEKLALAQDSCGAGEYRGGLGFDMHIRMVEDTYITSAVERTRNKPWGLSGGSEARPNAICVEHSDGRITHFYGKATRFLIAKGDLLKISSGGGGGHGPAANRPAEAVLRDLREQYISVDFARTHYPHVAISSPLEPVMVSAAKE
jgi:N-methylhydantoinase B